MTMATEQYGATTFSFPSDLEIVIQREFDAPRQLVFDAITKPEHIPNWWGPREWAVTSATADLRPGGAWHYTARNSNDGREMGMHGEYREIVPPERIVSTESLDGTPGYTVNTVVLTEADGKTMLTTTVLAPSKEVRDMIVNSGMQHGAAESYDRLAEHLHTMA
ncbi:MAG TPA: SRPBCC family protein [Candidatus Dormibacteraeota bacterium]|jgi:uncharacterized protein YndB with AHSA1/START domain|nr:SRPBCC family protein [Candidatus Dormibacteraeota bacterium]